MQECNNVGVTHSVFIILPNTSNSIKHGASFRGFQPLLPITPGDPATVDATDDAASVEARLPSQPHQPVLTDNMLEFQDVCGVQPFFLSFFFFFFFFLFLTIDVRAGSPTITKYRPWRTSSSWSPGVPDLILSATRAPCSGGA